MPDHPPRTGIARGYFPRYRADPLMFDNGVVADPGGSAGMPIHKRHIVEQLQADVLDEAHGIEVQVHDGHVTISGTVHSMAARRCIDESVRSAPGVLTVDDQLRVTT